MVSPAWREELRGELARRGLPPWYVERLVQELCDHYEDMEEEMRMDATNLCSPAERMGPPAEVAAAAAAAYRERAFSRRHPVVTFAVLPVLLLLGVWVGLGLTAGAIGAGLGLGDDAPPTPLELQLMNYVSHVVLLAPLAAVALFFGHFARRRRLDRRWPLLTTGILATIAGVTWNGIMPGPGHEPVLALFVGLPFSAQPLLQALLILALGGWSCWRGRRPRLAS